MHHSKLGLISWVFFFFFPWYDNSNPMIEIEWKFGFVLIYILLPFIQILTAITTKILHMTQVQSWHVHFFYDLMVIIRLNCELRSIARWEHELGLSANKIWWLCLVPTSTTRFASEVGYRIKLVYVYVYVWMSNGQNLIVLYKENISCVL